MKNWNIWSSTAYWKFWALEISVSHLISDSATSYQFGASRLVTPFSGPYQAHIDDQNRLSRQVLQPCKNLFWYTVQYLIQKHLSWKKYGKLVFIRYVQFISFQYLCDLISYQTVSNQYNFYMVVGLDGIYIMNNSNYQCEPDIGPKKEQPDGKLLFH